MNSWERFNETPDKKAFCSKLYLEDITHEDYRHDQKVLEEFGLKNLGEYHDLYVQSNTLLPVDVFENFRNKCIKINEIDSAHFLSVPDLSWQACLKKPGLKLELLADIDMLLMIEKVDEDLIKKYDENSSKGYILEVDVEYPRKLDNLYSDLPFLAERMKINKRKKPTCKINYKKKLCSSHKSSKTSLNKH